MACIITGVYGVNRNYTLENNSYDLIKDWANSVIKLKLYGIIFHNSFSEETIETHSSPYLKFIRVEYNERYNTNIFRYFLYYQYILTHKHLIKNIFLTDITDVIVVKNPFKSKFYQLNNNKLFCGDEPKKLKNEWMLNHGKHFRGVINDYQQFEIKYENAILLNCGIIGGEAILIEEFLEKICSIHEKYNKNTNLAFTGDMGAFNYLMRTQFEDRFLHGEPCNTVFKEYQRDRNDCWFRHK